MNEVSDDLDDIPVYPATTDILFDNSLEILELSPTSRKRCHIISPHESEEEVDEDLQENAAGLQDASTSRLTTKSQPSTEMYNAVTMMEHEQQREKDVSFKRIKKEFQNAVCEAKKHDSEHIVNVLETGFLMLCAKMDTIRQSLQYDLKEGHKQLNASIALKGEPHSSLAELKLKLDVSLPSENMNSFETLDAALLASEEKKKDCVTLIKALAFGAKTENDAIDAVLQEFMSKNVQLQYSGRGRVIKGRGKKDFSATQLCGITLDILMTQFDVKKDVLLAKISRWLSGAPDREGGRRQRTTAGT